MAAEANHAALSERVLQLREEVKTLKETDEKLKSHEVCCQKAKEWFLNKKLQSMTDQSVEEGPSFDLPDECKADVQFSEILGLLTDIKKEQKRLLMLQHQLHSAQKQQEVRLLNDILLKHSMMLHKCTTQSHDNSPLAMWYAEIAQSVKTNLTEPIEEKFSETNNLFYNVNYFDGTGQPQDLLVETIYKKKIKRDQRKKDAVEELQFSTCHRGYCVQMTISRHDGHNNGLTNSLDPSSYHIYFDINLNNAKERLLEYLVSKKSLEEFVRQYVWKEIECLNQVITTLDIAHVTVRKCKAFEDNIEQKDEFEPNGVDHTLPEPAKDEALENSFPSTDKDEQTEGPITKDSNGKDTVTDENADSENENETKLHETSENSKMHESQAAQIQTMDPRKLTRSESAFSKVSNFSMHAQNSSLSSKVFALDEKLKRLENIVGSLISQCDVNYNQDDPNSGQLGGMMIKKEDPKSLEQNENNSSSHRDRSTSVGLGQKKVDGSKSDSGHTEQSTHNVLAKASLKRPVTQPVLASAKQVPVLPRSKTADLLPRKKHLVRKLSQLEMFKPRQFFPTIDEEVHDAGGLGTEGVTEDKQDIQGGIWIDDDVSKEIQPNEEWLSTVTDSEVSAQEIEDIIEQEIEAALSDPSDPQNITHALRLGLKQMQRWREEFQVAQENFRLEVEACRNYIQSLAEDMNVLRAERKNQQTEHFNTVHRIHRQIIDLEQNQTKLSKTVNELVDEYNRHESTFSDILNSIEKLDDQKVDKVLLSSQVDDKANKDELRDKVSLRMFDESFTLLDQGLNDALEKMSNQMSMEEALRETLSEMQSGMEMKLNREEMENLKKELEARIKEVRAAQEKGLVGKNELPRDPAGFKRFMEKVRCISCDRDVEIESSQAPALPSLPKIKPLGGIPPSRSRDIHMLKKTADEDYHLSKLKTEMITGTGLHDLTMFPMSQRFCGGRHTITRGNKRFLGPTLNDYIVIRESDHVSLPPREFVVSRDSGLRRLTKRKLPGINDLRHLPGVPEEGNILKENGENNIGNSDKNGKNEQFTRIEK